MTIRRIMSGDLPGLKALHERMGAEYPFPDPWDGTFYEVLVIEDGARIVAGMAARKVAEMYCWLDRGWETPGMRALGLQRLLSASVGSLMAQHVQDCHALLPPGAGRAFGRRLEAAGWWHPTWPLWARKVGDG